MSCPICFSGTEYPPAYFKLGEGNTSACLATGFSRHNAAASHAEYGKEFMNQTKAVAISPQFDLYNQVIFPEDGAKSCGGKFDKIHIILYLSYKQIPLKHLMT